MTVSLAGRPPDAHARIGMDDVSVLTRPWSPDGRDTAWAMSKENVEVVRRGFEAFQRGGPEAMLDLFSDNVITYRPEPDGATLHGKAGFPRRSRRLDGGFQRVADAPPAVHRSGRAGPRRLIQIAQGRNSGVRVEEDWWVLFELTSSKVSKLSFYSNPAEALEAAGLRE